MRAQPEHLYALIQEGAIHQLFTAAELPEWHDGLLVVDITNVDPRPQAGWRYQDGAFTDPATLPESIKRSADTTRDSKIAAGVTYNGRRFDSDERSIRNLTATLAAVTAGAFVLPRPFYWRSADNENVDMSLDDLKGLAAAMIAAGYAAYLEAWAAKDALGADEKR